MTIRGKAIICWLTLPLALMASSEKPTQAEDAKADQKLAAKIQKTIARDESHSLSASAHQVQVIVEKGVITLKGTVQSDEESQAIQGEAESLAIRAKSHTFADDTQIHNELTVPSK